MKRPGRWQRKKDGKRGHRISCRESNMIDSIIRSGGFKEKNMACLENSLAENIA